MAIRRIHMDGIGWTEVEIPDRPKKKEEFEDWKNRMNRMSFRYFGVELDDLPDIDYRTLYSEGAGWSTVQAELLRMF